MQIKQENDGHAVIDQLTGEEVLTCAINYWRTTFNEWCRDQPCRRYDYEESVQLTVSDKPYIFHCILYQL